MLSLIMILLRDISWRRDGEDNLARRLICRPGHVWLQNDMQCQAHGCTRDGWLNYGLLRRIVLVSSQPQKSNFHLKVHPSASSVLSIQPHEADLAQ